METFDKAMVSAYMSSVAKIGHQKHPRGRQFYVDMAAARVNPGRKKKVK